MQAAALVQEFVDEVRRCQQLAEGEKPSAQDWEGHLAQRFQAIQAFALEAAEDAEAAFAVQNIQVSLCIKSCRICWICSCS